MNDLTMRDLFVACEKCGGSGHVPRDSQVTSGAPGVYTSGEHGTCPACNGWGGKLTPAGEAVLEFVRLMKAKGQF